MKTSQQAMDRYKAVKRFLVETLGDGFHVLPNYFADNPPLALDIHDFDDEFYEIEVLPKELADDISLEKIADHVARTHGVVPRFRLPEPSKDKHAALKASIEKFGIIQPVIQDEDGQFIDGLDRKKIANELGISCPTTVVGGLDYAARQQLAFELNTCRRQITLNAKRAIATEQLQSSPWKSDRDIGRAGGLDHKTVGAIRSDLESREQIVPCKVRTGKDGKKYRFASVRCKSSSDVEKASKLFSTLGDDVPRRELSLRQAQRMIRTHRKDTLARSFIWSPVEDGDIQILHQDFRKLDLADESTDLIFTDLPYLQKNLHLYGDLSEFAARVLKPGGLVLAYAGTYDLPEIMRLLGQHLKYYWQHILLHSKCSVGVHPKKVFAGYKPILCFSKGKGKPLGYVQDVFQCEGPEKELHEWQQGVGEAKYYIERLTRPGDLIVDCCGGSFTTAEAVLRIGGRRFIGCDIDPGCVAIGQERCAKVRAELLSGAATTAGKQEPLSDE